MSELSRECRRSATLANLQPWPRRQPLAEQAEFAFAGDREREGEIAVLEAELDDVFIDDITFPAVDGYALGATLFLPRGATPADADTSAIGHLGFFRPEHRDTLWRGAAEWLEAEG
jgi:hypothetical protein